MSARLCHDVLARTADTDKASAVLLLDDEKACEVLRDAMMVLASKDIKLSAARRGGSASEVTASWPPLAKALSQRPWALCRPPGAAARSNRMGGSRPSRQCLD